MLNKLLSWLALLGLLMGVLVGCTQKPESVEIDTDETPTVEEIRTLRIIGPEQTYPGEKEDWAELVAEFEKEFNCKVDYEFQGEFYEVSQMLETARMAGEPVDICQTGAGLINSTLVRAGIVKDLTEYIKPFEHRFSEGSLLPVTINDRIWGIPIDAAATCGVFYNKTMFDELGLEEPKTYQEMLEISKIISEEKGIMPMIQDGKMAFFWPIWYFETYAQVTGNNSIERVVEFLSGERQFTGEEEKLAFDLIAQFYKDGILTQESFDTDSDAKFAIFAQEKAAMMYAGSWHLAPARAAVGDSFEMGVFEFPIVVDGAISQHGGGATGSLVVPSFADPKNFDLSRQFFEFLTRKENATKFLRSRDPIGPTIASVPSSENEPLAKKLDEFYPNTITFLDWIWPMEVNDAFVSGIPAVVSGSMTSEEAAQGVQDALDMLIKEQNFKFDWWNSWTDADWKKVEMQNLPDIYVSPEN